MNFIQFFYRFVFFFGYTTVLITALIPMSGGLSKISLGPELIQIRLDHFLHFSVYFLICIYFLLGVRLELHLFKVHSISKFAFLVLFLAIGSELLQIWVPSRAFNIFDMISNILGFFVGLWIIKVKNRQKKSTITES